MKQLFSMLFAKKNSVALCVALFVANAHANINDGNNPMPVDVKIIREELNLVANKVKIKEQTLLIDSALLKLEIEREEAMLPADELYDGEWNNEFVRAYSNCQIPDSFRIDVTSFVNPFNGKITSHFGIRRRRFHYGTDIKLQIGDTVVAAFDGKVRIRKDQGRRKGYGKYIVLRHSNGLETIYGHLSGYLVDLEENVKAGQPIALGGNTGRSSGSHLHFECRFLGMPVNPEEIVDFENECTFDESYLFVKSKAQRYNYASARQAQRRQRLHATKQKTATPAAKSSYSPSTKKYLDIISDGKLHYHRVKNGDTLGAIAAKYGTTVSKLCKLNGITSTTKLKIGKVLRCS
ncbi:MAG: peptidoglycan DD-metalloendopeptidase family protein [Dysgonamonadaceae bacterium]|jgi:murein DD-endopeptidase MepM/ murein hydrolase activator NlpD|nr:peptidoglycan DD-metalloendopeptidase family protein [Dysgonamonadaceae bacterium]